MCEAIWITTIACIIGLILSAWVTVSTLKHIVGQFGNDNQGKRLIALKYLFHFYAVLILSFVLLTRALNFINDQLFIALFVIVLSGLGFKITHDIFENKKTTRE